MSSLMTAGHVRPEPPGDVCLAIGNEDYGCSPPCWPRSPPWRTFRSRGRVGSLNAAVATAIATAIATAEACRREWHLKA
jgi:tRNA (guanosine-2'-O-)-methyltransferase